MRNTRNRRPIKTIERDQKRTIGSVGNKNLPDKVDELLTEVVNKDPLT